MLYILRIIKRVNFKSNNYTLNTYGSNAMRRQAILKVNIFFILQDTS